MFLKFKPKKTCVIAYIPAHILIGATQLSIIYKKIMKQVPPTGNQFFDFSLK